MSPVGSVESRDRIEIYCLSLVFLSLVSLCDSAHLRMRTGFSLPPLPASSSRARCVAEVTVEGKARFTQRMREGERVAWHAFPVPRFPVRVCMPPLLPSSSLLLRSFTRVHQSFVRLCSSNFHE